MTSKSNAKPSAPMSSLAALRIQSEKATGGSIPTGSFAARATS